MLADEPRRAHQWRREVRPSSSGDEPRHVIASKAARVVLAAGIKVIEEFGSRTRSAAVDAARAAYAAGFVGTSKVEAGMRFGVPVTGTAAHM
ncbi:MAG: hypothetical protein V9G14_17810 [Cypionkella sp.]